MMWSRSDVPDADTVTIPPLTKYEWYVLWERALGNRTAEESLVKLTKALTA